MSIAGQCSVDDARTALKRVARRCVRFGFPVKFKGFKVIAVKWTQAYRPAFPVDFLELQRHPEADLRQTSSSQALRILLPCGSVGGRDAGSGPGAGGSASGARPGEAGEQGEQGEQGGQASQAEVGVLAEVSADGRTRFHGAKSVEELNHALGVVVSILEKYKLPGMDDGGPPGVRQPAGLGRPLGGRRRGPILSREALELEEPVQAGLAVKEEVPVQAALVVPMVGRP